MFARSVSRFVVRQPGPPTRARFSGTSARSAVTARRWLAVLLVLTPPAVLHADEPAQAQGPGVRAPQSPQDHAELAGLYQRLAAQRREPAESLRKSLAAQIQRIAVAPNKTGIEVTRVKREAQTEISQAETVVAEAEPSAEYHRMRAKKLAGLEFAALASTSSGERR